METHGNRIAFDIETVANERANLWWDNVEIEAPKNYKDPEKIKAYIDEKRAGLYGKSALRWNTGKVFTFAVMSVSNPDDFYFAHSLSEADLLNDIAEKCEGHEVWAKHGFEYDFPFLVGRYLANNIPVPKFLRNNFERCKDVNHFFSRRASSDQVFSLDAYAHGLGIDLKDGSWKLVGELYNTMVTQGDTTELLKQVENYNVQDVRIVAEMVRRYYGY